VEVTYSEFGERGSIDVLGGRRDVGAAVVVEVKADLTVVDATVRKLDEKARLVRRLIGRQRLGWQPRTVGRLLVLPASGAARRRVAGAAAVLEAALPARGRDVRRWLRTPHGDLAGIQFVPNANPGGGRRIGRGPKRVRPAGPSVPAGQRRGRSGRDSALHNSHL
jgi:hypothetical protein